MKIRQIKKLYPYLFSGSKPTPEPSFPDFELVGSPVVGHAQATAEGATVTLTLPEGIEVGDKIFAVSSHKLQGGVIDGPEGFQAHKHDQHNNGNNGTDVGPTTITTFSKTADGEEGESVTFQFIEPEEDPATTTTNVLSVVLFVLRPGSSEAKISVQVVPGFHRSYDESTNMDPQVACKAVNWASIKKGDFIACVGSSNADTYRYINRGLSNVDGLTIETVEQNFISANTNNGNDQYLLGSLFKVTAGNLSKALPQYDALSVSAADNTTPASGTRNPWVATHIIIVRQQTAEPEYMPSRYSFMDPSTMDELVFDQHGGFSSVCVDIQGDGVSFDLAEYHGEKHILIKHRFDDYMTNVNRRGEIFFSPLQPRYYPGIKLFCGARVRCPAYPELPYQWLMWQNHTGRFTGATSPNHPIASFEWARANQYRNIDGWMMGSTYLPAGSLVICMNAIGNGDHYYKAFPDINYIGTNKDFKFGIMMKFGLAGDGQLTVMWDDEIIFDATDKATMADVPETLGNGSAPTGSVAMVGGYDKLPGYLHQLDTAGDPSDMKEYYDAYVSAGLAPEMLHYIKGLKRSIKTPNDPDYDSEFDLVTLQRMQIS
jgi:hypothetical protein